MTAHVTRRRYIEREAHPNTASWRDDAAREDARLGSELLAATIERAGLNLAPAPEQRRRTFEETLRLVETGRVGIVANVKVRAPEPSFSIVGGTPWESFG